MDTRGFAEALSTHGVKTEDWSGDAANRNRHFNAVVVRSG